MHPCAPTGPIHARDTLARASLAAFTQRIRALLDQPGALQRASRNLLHAAAELGHGDALLQLALSKAKAHAPTASASASAKAVAELRSDALPYLRSAARAGHGESLAVLGACYERGGAGLSSNPVEAARMCVRCPAGPIVRARVMCACKGGDGGLS